VPGGGIRPDLGGVGGVALFTERGGVGVGNSFLALGEGVGIG
jgi:hypothetical protein